MRFYARNHPCRIEDAGSKMPMLGGGIFLSIVTWTTVFDIMEPCFPHHV